MPRARSPDRDKAFVLWRDSAGSMQLNDIADRLKVSEGTVRGWKAKDRWVEQLNGTLQSIERNAPKRKVGAPKGNKYAVGNIGGSGGPQGNNKAVTHGFFRKYFPAEVQEIIGEAASISELDMLWMMIKTQFAAIVRAQPVMFVKDAADHSEFVVSHTTGSDSESVSKMIQPAWDKQANFLQAQSRAMKTLEGLISRYTDMLPTSPSAEEHCLRIEKLQAEIARLKNGETNEEYEDDGFMEALKRSATEVWGDVSADSNDNP